MSANQGLCSWVVKLTTAVLLGSQKLYTGTRLVGASLASLLLVVGAGLNSGVRAKKAEANPSIRHLVQALALRAVKTRKVPCFKEVVRAQMTRMLHVGTFDFSSCPLTDALACYVLEQRPLSRGLTQQDKRLYGNINPFSGAGIQRE
ncbi:hypothetical protein M7I_8344 [Glarea lozoyensis 74030]|uniref:Uncharacterized protein n=1 Tax=Glarea lozoyensis (strain ATCC 74030 / MF5533) TaxID=1104152 RepID=H0EZR6_GLAL7|nr:hypothetical protein M7I_8344 [Glarea lozoyensis 74030]